MRTLKEEIAYCREKGFHRNTIELSTMYSWLGERASEDDELKSLREKVFQLQGESMGMQHRINHLEAVLRKHKIGPEKAAPEYQEPVKTMICKRCGADRFKEHCKQPDFGCPMVATALDSTKYQEPTKDNQC